MEKQSMHCMYSEIHDFTSFNTRDLGTQYSKNAPVGRPH